MGFGEEIFQGMGIGETLEYGILGHLITSQEGHTTGYFLPATTMTRETGMTPTGNGR